MSQAADILTGYCAELETGDAGALEQLALDVVFHSPCMQPPAPKMMTGLATVETSAFNRILTHFFKEFRWTKLEVNAGADPALAFAPASSRIVQMNGKIYKNDYTLFSHVKNGKISEHYKFFDAVRATVAFSA